MNTPPKIPFEKWREICLQQNDLSGEVETLRDQVKSIFSMLFSSTKIDDGNGNTVLETKSSHNESLAQLIKELDKCFSVKSIHITRIWALNCLHGAVDGCQTLSFEIFKLLSIFLLSYCSPLLEEAEFSEDTEEMVRDSAMSCLKALIETPLEMNNSVPNHVEVIRQKLTFAYKAVANRCATESSTEDFDQGYSLEASCDFREGLSLLPRSRRSLCFSLIRTAIDSVGAIQLDGPIEDEGFFEVLIDFTKFSTKCLHGESDPRCLMELLSMLTTLLRTLSPLFNLKRDTFPTVAVFDAVAPYYPIQFTPPPNDKYGITRSGLQQALMGVLNNSDFDSKGDRESMLNLACGIVLERLIPSSDNDSTDEDKLEALQDLLLILGNRCHLLSPESVRELSNALIAAHSEGSSGAALGKTGPQKSIANTCRNLVSIIAAELETTDLWEVFVQEPIQSDLTCLAISPESTKGRNTIAYFACLAASGGKRSFQFTFDQCMPQLISVLKESEEEEKISAAALGVGAFFSSYQVAVERSGDKIVLNPHPLQSHSATVLAVLADCFQSNKQQPAVIVIVQALLSLLMVTPEDILEDTEYEIIMTFLKDLRDLVIQPKLEIDDDEIQTKLAKSLGTIIGIANQAGSSSVLGTKENIRDFINETILAKLTTSVIDASTTSDTLFHIHSLAKACDSSENVATKVVDDVMNILSEKLNSGQHQDVLEIAKTTGIILEHGGKNASNAFHSTKVNPVDIIKIIGRGNDNPIQGVIKVGISLLQLPRSEQELEEEAKATCYGHQVTSQFLRAYDASLPKDRIKSLLDFVGHVLPPISDWETVQLGISLPLFTKMLQYNDLSEEITVKLVGMVKPLAALAVEEQANTQTRAAAASSIFWIIYRHQSKNNEECLSNSVLQDSIFPELKERLDSFDDLQSEVSIEKVKEIQNSLNLLALVGSAAACRVCPSSTKVSNEIATILLQLAFEGKAVLSSSVDKVLSFKSVILIKMPLQLAAASAYNTMVSCKFGSPFWRQRILHIALKAIQNDTFNENVDSFDCLGRLSLVCLIAMKAKPSTLSDAILSTLSRTLMKGMVFLFRKNSGNGNSTIPENTECFALQELVFVAAIRLTSCFPKKMGACLDIMVPIALRILSQDKDTGLMILTLQLLHTISNQFVEEDLLRFKTAVESILGDLCDHPLSMFRQMVVETRNLWSL